MDIPIPDRLVILLDKATNPGNSELDVATIDSFCCLVKNDPNLSSYATKLLAEKIQSAQKNESLNALNLLEECMSKCGNKFQSVVGTFRFLNELVKLVSPKYLGNQTDQQIKTKILDLLLLWKVQYPHESKIKEAYEMLCRQGVVHEQVNQIKISGNSRPKEGLNSRKDEDPTSLKIKQLIQAKNPDRVDIHAANLLIQNYYEVEKKKTLRVQEIKKGKENVCVLSEMIDHYSVAESSQDDLSLIKELHETCKNLQPMILLLTEEQNQDESVMSEALETNDLLLQVLEKYDKVVMGNDSYLNVESLPTSNNNSDPFLIDMQLSEEVPKNSSQLESNKTDDMNALADIFGQIPEQINSNLMDHTTALLQPQSLNENPLETPIETSKTADIDSMISQLLKSSLSPGPSSEPIPLKHDLEGIEIDVETITPSDESPKIAIEQPKGMKVVLNFTKEHPRPDVAVLVATIANLSTENVTNIDLLIELLENEDKSCELKQLPPSGTSLGKVRPFRALDEIVQVVLLSNPKRIQPKLNIILKYSEEIDPRKEQKVIVLVNDLPKLF